MNLDSRLPPRKTVLTSIVSHYSNRSVTRMSVDIFKLDGQDGKALPIHVPQKVGFLETYRYIMEDAADSRVADWFLMGSPFPLLGIIFLYLLFVLRFGPLFMKNRKPYNLNKFMICYNISMAIASATVFYGLLTSGFTTKFSLGCETHVISNDPDSYRTARWVWRLLMLKVLELSDTVIFILRKKYNQASFLHVYHHTSTAFLSWIACKFVPGGMWTFTIMPNCIVHVIMYTYYLLACLGPQVQKRIAPWKQYITGLQMFQFIIMICHMFQTLLPTCEPNRKPIAYIYMSQILVMFCMFCDYYKKSYLRKKTE
ncbi:elongation of very long chain fatty acids protein 1-like [Bombus pyrosoma]|uniref:elongation of very long chain fatty acids protein 1-like n=1 Tax=Bombus pyrosoma TaxID=396416 RepID=UPI001CB9BBD2|nr:elongation of very long chain fatty acids protein 1-like [Bombus pyrosoma]XP_043581824.1 elongation of very long chain fatty acids protein 1-like [Bombus pyrosoma]